MNLPQDSKIWIFQSQRNFTAEEIVEIEQTLDAFMKEWNAHGAALTAAYAIPYDRFIVLAVDENHTKASGCSIDSMTRIIKGLEEKYQFGLLNRMLVSYQIDGEIITLPLAEFKQKVKNNEIPMHASVFHNGITRLDAFEEGWELPLSESWAATLIQATNV
ncbi:ABC transporter ATPase [Moheibacter stercoris]|uniref:ABC transporter ATPase n=1 Tax=Moheibacter stercoris TaxID=1628251 RepID=A0ABV2LTQ8_9FLAO